MPSKRYNTIISQLMSYIDGREYSANETFTPNDLLRVTPIHIKEWMTLKAYSTVAPNADTQPVNARSNTLLFYKKAISSFMPRKNVVWDPIRNEGNPTRSDSVNQLIRAVMKSEVRRQGAQSCARRPLEFDEFLCLLSMVNSLRCKNNLKYMILSALTLQ